MQKVDPENAIYAHKLEVRPQASETLGVWGSMQPETPESINKNPEAKSPKPKTYLSSVLGKLKVNLWDRIGIIVPQKG